MPTKVERTVPVGADAALERYSVAGILHPWRWVCKQHWIAADTGLSILGQGWVRFRVSLGLVDFLSFSWVVHWLHDYFWVDLQRSGPLGQQFFLMGNLNHLLVSLSRWNHH